MLLLPILLVAAVMAVDGGLKPFGAAWGLSDGLITALACGPVAVILLSVMLGMRRCQRQLTRRRTHLPIIAAERLARNARVLLGLNHLLAVLGFGWLGVIRHVIGNPILIDEVIAILPPLLGLVGVWWAYYPLERRLREAVLIRRLDEGRPVYPMPSRAGYVLLQIRLQLLLLLVPVLAIAAISEIINDVGSAWGLSNSVSLLIGIGKLAAGAGVFMLAPLVARVVLDVQPLPGGPLRQMLQEVCAQHRVKVRELLLWNTNGSVFNAAVMGLIGPLRYVLLTDALLESLREDQVRAVMAHEIGHVRRHHMPWLVACLMASFTAVALALELPARGVEQLGWTFSQPVAEGVEMGLTVVWLALGFSLFGWVSRRFERQADTFAVQHLSSMGRPPVGETAGADQPVHVSAEAVEVMRGALDGIAWLNNLDPRRPSWRHGSIAWRVAYLLSIIGRPIAGLPIDRVVRRIKLATALVLLAAAGYSVIEHFEYQPPSTPREQEARSVDDSATMATEDVPWR